MKDLTGQRFGKLIAVKYLYSKDKRAYWLVKCDCGKEAEKNAKYLLNGDTTSCGCILAKNGRSKTRLYRIWAGMMTRCYNKKRRSYRDYGGRGIIVCDRWHNFNNFYEDMIEGYKDDLTLDRFPDRHGNYEPGNVRWATIHEQARNKDRTKEYLFNGKKMIIPEIAKEIGVSPFTLYSRIANGCIPEEAFKTKINIADISKKYGISYDKLHHRIVNMKLTIKEAVNYERYK